MRGWFAGLLLCLSAATASADILVLGDSVLARGWRSGESVADVIAERTRMRVHLRAEGGTGYLARTSGSAIASRYEPGPWSHVVLDGGANDLLQGCGCRAGCAPLLDRLIAPGGGGGLIVDLVRRARGDGAEVLLLGYYDGPSFGQSVFTACADELAVLNGRLSALAGGLSGVRFLDAGTVIDPDDPAHYASDRVHASALGARRIGEMLASAIRR